MRLQDVFENGQFARLFGFERILVVQYQAVAVAENVGGIPAFQAQHAGFETRCQDSFHEGLPGLEVFPGNGYFFSAASSIMAGISMVRFGAPLMKGILLSRAARA